MKIRTKSLLFSLIIALLLFQTCFTKLEYMDEIITTLSFLYLIFDSIKHKTDNKFICIIVLMIIMVILGTLGNYVYKIQTNKVAILLDIESMFKSFICFMAFYRLFEKTKDEDKKCIINYLTIICKITVFIGFVLAIINIFYNIGMYTDISYGFRSFHYIFRRVGNLNNFCVRSLLIFTLALYHNKDNNDNNININNNGNIKIYILMNLLLMISTLRTRAFASAIIYFFGYLYFIKGKRIKIKVRYIIPILLIVLYIALPKINYFFNNNTTRARNVLLSYGIKTAKNYYPIGSGFATYGTSVAQNYDSRLHKIYNFNNYYGLSTDDGYFLTDNYWPAIMGEIGFIGALIMLILLIIIFKIIIRKTHKNNITRFGSLFVFVTLLISSLVSSSFFNTMAVSGMILISLALNYNEKTIIKENL